MSSRIKYAFAALLSFSFLACSGGGLDGSMLPVSPNQPPSAQPAMYVTDAFFDCQLPQHDCSAFDGVATVAATCLNDQTTDPPRDFVAFQNAVKWSAHYGAELLLPAGVCYIGTHTLQLTHDFSDPTNPLNLWGPRIRGAAVSAESVSSVILYAGTGTALLDPGPTSFNGHLSNLVVEYKNPAPNGVALDLVGANQWYFDNVAIQGGPYQSGPPESRDLGTGIRCSACAIVWFNNITFNGQVKQNAGLPLRGQISFVNKGFLFTGGNSGAIHVLNTTFSLVRRGVNFSAAGFVGGPSYYPTMVFENNHFDPVGTDFYFDNANSIQIDNLVIRGNQFSHYGMLDPENAVIAIDHTAASVFPGRLQITGVFEENNENCFGSQCQMVVASATNITRTGSTVTVMDTADLCVFFGGPVTGQTTSNPFPGTKVYKTGSTDPNFPGGMKTITALKPDNCVYYDPNLDGVNCPPATPPRCTGFTYNEPVDCSGAGLCAPGCSGPCMSLQSADFTSGDYFIKEIRSDAAKNSASAVRLVVRNNEMHGWTNGAFMSYSKDVQIAPCTTCSNTTVQLESNLVSNTQFVTRNFGAVWGAGSPGGQCANIDTIASQYTGPELRSCRKEVFISNTLGSNTGTVFPTVVHWPYRSIYQLASGSALALVPDYQDVCTCRDLSVPTAICNVGALMPVASPPFPNFEATTTITVNAGGSDSVELECW